jgi:hypothetical protein
MAKKNVTASRMALKSAIPFAGYGRSPLYLHIFREDTITYRFGIFAA